MLANLFKIIATVLIFPTIFFMHGAGYQISKTPATTVAPAPKAGAFNPTGGGTYYLFSSVSSTQNTVTLSSFTEPTSNIPYTMTYLNSSIEYATIAPQTTQSEFISFTGVTQNNDGSATLTGVTRGLDRSYPYTASTTLALPHAGQSRFILSNPPQLTNQYGALANTNTWADVNTFTSTAPPTYDTDPIWANFGTQIFADVAYVNSVVAAGAANGSETVKGIYQLATAAQAAIGASVGSTGARLVLGANLATTTPLFTGTNVIPVTGTNQKLSQLFLDLTQAFTVSGLWKFGAGFIGQASSTVSANLDVQSLTVASAPAQFSKFGGTGADGALSCSSGTTTIALGGVAFVVKNYTSISITGNCYVQLTGGNANGTEVILKSLGNVTLTSTDAPMLDATSTGAFGATAVSCNNASGNGASGNGAGAFGFTTSITPGGGGQFAGPTGGATGGVSALGFASQTNTSQTLYYNVFVGPGGGGGTCGPNTTNVSKGGAGGNGGGALIIEVGGALNFTTTNGISVAGSVGGASSVTSGAGVTSAGGGGGSGGFFEMFYNTLTANSGSINVSGGGGGAGAGSGNNNASGAGGGNPVNNGIVGTANGSTPQTGGNGGAGYSLIGQNPR